MDHKEKNIQEAKTYEIKEEPEVPVKEHQTEEEKKSPIQKGKIDFYMELVLFFVLGVLLGIAVKTSAVKKITMGFNDYKMNIQRQDYDINQLQSKLFKEEIKKKKAKNQINEKDAQSSQSNNNSKK